MDYTITINLFYILWISILVVVLYVYIKDDSDDYLTQMRHDVETRKEWFRMLAEQNKQRAKSESWKNRRA
jgi:hypothetical protein